MTDWGPKTSVAMLAGSAAFVAAGLFVLIRADQAEPKLAGLAAIVFFGGGIPMSLFELSRYRRRRMGGTVDMIWGFPAARTEMLVLAVTASGMAVGSYLLQYMPQKPFVEALAWIGSCFFGFGAIVFAILGLRNRNTP
jgi:hypothetical protein